MDHGSPLNIRKTIQQNGPPICSGRRRSQRGKKAQDNGRQHCSGPCGVCFYRSRGNLSHYPILCDGRIVGQVVCGRTEKYVWPAGQSVGHAVGGRRCRRCARFSNRWCFDHHVYRFSGPFADDPEHVYDCGQPAARGDACVCSGLGNPCLVHFWRPQRCDVLPLYGICHAVQRQSPRGDGSGCGGPPDCHCGPGSFPALL